MSIAAVVLMADDEVHDASRRSLQPVPSVRQESEPEPARSAGGRGVILVVDDDEALRESLVEILDLAGYVVLQAADGEEALSVLDRQSVDVLLLDLQMPGRDGLSVLEALEPPPPKVILFSAFARYSHEDIDRMGLGAKVSRALRKPVAPVQLLAAIQDAMEELRHED